MPVGPLVAEALREVAAECRLAGVAAELVVEADAPALLRPALFRRALGNVLANAVQAMAGGGRLTVRVSAGAVRVIDRGGRVRELVDTNRALERWLLDHPGTRLAAGDQPLVSQLLRQLNEQHPMADTHESSQQMVGTWTKTTTAACADKYPATLTFSTGTYRGMRSPDQGMVSWDAGIYRLEDPRTLVVGTATDELVKYEIEMKGDQFEFTDADGCRVTYRRHTRTP